MLTLLKRLWRKLLYDEMAVRRWGRAGLMAVAGSGLAFADGIAGVLEAPGAVRAIKLTAVIAGFLSVAINLGDRNPRPQP